jgi:hypothetical protein
MAEMRRKVVTRFIILRARDVSKGNSVDKG